MGWRGVLVATTSAALALVPAAGTADPPLLVFSSNRAPDLHGELYSIEADGSGRRNLTRSPARDGPAALSPDGRTIAFVSDRSGTLSLWTVPSRGGPPRRVRGAEVGPSLDEPAWDPTGRRLLFYGPVGGDCCSVWIVRPHREQPRRVARAGFGASWSPDGRRLVVVAGGAVSVAVYSVSGRLLWRAPGVAAGWSRSGEVAVTSLRPDRVTVYSAAGVVRARVAGTAPAWSPDGRTLAFVRGDAVWLLEPVGRPRRLIRAPGAWSVRWTHDGRILVFDRSGARAVTTRGRARRASPDLFGVWSRDHRRVAYVSQAGIVAGAASGRRRLVLRGESGPCESRHRPIAWLPDGRLLLQAGFEGKNDADIFTVGPDRPGTPRRWAGDADWQDEPSPSPDGTSIVYETAHPVTHADSCGEGYEGQRLVLARRDGSGARVLGSPGGLLDDNPSWSPDDTRLAFERNALSECAECGLVVVDVRTGAERQVTRPGVAARDERPSWSPSGTELVFERNDVLHVIAADGSGSARRLVAGTLPAWSPRGDWIAFVRDGALFLVRPDGTEVTGRLVDVGRAASLSWAPDGREVAVAASNGIVAVTPDQPVRVRFVERGHGLDDPAWSPDATRLAFVGPARLPGGAILPGSREVFVVNADGTEEIRITSDFADARAPRWVQSPR